MLKDYKDLQPIAYRILSNSIDKAHFNHAYLFETNGYERGLDMAISFAKSILCPNKNLTKDACNGCSQCKMIDENNYPEIKIIEPEGLWIKKEQLIQLHEEFNKKSIMGNKKVYIINKAERLNANSSNTLLKFIEEPPEGIIAILVTDNIYQLLDTIISRCQIISLNGQASLEKKDSTISKVAQFLSNTQEEYDNFLTNNDIIDNVIGFINYYEKNGKKILLHMNQYWFNNFNERSNFNNAIEIIIYFYKDCLNLKIGCDVEIFNDFMDDINYVTDKNTLNELVKKLEVLTTNKYFINTNVNLNLLMDKIIIELEGGV